MSDEVFSDSEVQKILLEELLNYNYSLTFSIFAMTFAFYLSLAKGEIREFFRTDKRWLKLILLSLFGNISFMMVSQSVFKAQITVYSGAESWDAKGCEIYRPLPRLGLNSCGEGAMVDPLTIIADINLLMIALNWALFSLVLTLVFRKRDERF